MRKFVGGIRHVRIRHERRASLKAKDSYVIIPPEGPVREKGSSVILRPKCKQWALIARFSFPHVSMKGRGWRVQFTVRIT